MAKMRDTCVMILWVLLAALGGCDKEVPAQQAAAEEEEPAPAPASDTGAATGAQFKVEPVITRVTSKYILKEEAQDKAWLRTKVSTDAGAVDGKVEVKIYHPGADLEESRPLKIGWSDRYLKVAPGDYDLLVTYQETSLARATGWIRNVPLKKAKLLRLEITLDYPVGRVRISPTIQGQDIASKTRVAVYRTDADLEEPKPLTTFWANRETFMPSGTYDLLLSYEESGAVRVEHWLRGVVVPGKRALLRKSAPLELAFSWVKVQPTNFGKDLGGKVRLRYYKAGADPEHVRPLLSSWSGRKDPLAAGSYDLQLSYDQPHAKKSIWKKGLVVSARRELLRVRPDFEFPLGRLEVMATLGSASLGNSARVQLFAAGQTEKPVGSLWTQRKTVVPAGTYDIKVSHKGTSVWDKGVKLKRDAEVTRTVKLPK